MFQVLSKINRCVDCLGSVFFFQYNVIVYFQYHLFRVPHELGDPFDRDFRNLVTEHGAVIVAEVVSGQVSDRFLGYFVHLPQDPCPHFVVAAF